ncbi:MAG: divalent-cation tolerance protein CutA [Deltaproteobacteria bacterium]|nr:divalent-cation tolerance protein CutA [Deltaproteobacteria bacterium]
MHSPFIQIMTTTARREDAGRIGETLVEKRLAACVQVIGPIRSIYRWKGNIERDEEWLCQIKSRRDLFDAAAQAIRAVHPYETPEIIALPIIAGSGDYLAWLEGELNPLSNDRQGSR